MAEPEIPEISTKVPLTLDEAVVEYKELTACMSNAPQYGWARAVEDRLESRQAYLRGVITNFICEVS